MERFDGFFEKVCDASTHGIEGFLDAVFSFLQRRSDFYCAADQAKSMTLKAFDKHLKTHQVVEDKKFHERQRELEAAPRIQEVKLEDENEELSTVQKKADETPSTGITPSTGNGGCSSKYSWQQTLASVDMSIPLSEKVTAKQCTVKIGSASLKVQVKEAILIDGSLSEKVDVEDSTWCLLDGKCLQISLEKQDKMHWWSCVLKGDPEIDTQKIVPENSKLTDLDPETRATVERMLWDQRQKQMGLPTSEETKQHELFEKFKKQNPNFDFSNAKINFN